MNTIDVVIDPMWGDGGKGKTTDWLCQKYDNPLVVRFSGGQQCGHTVVNEFGTHIHASFPSGSLRGCDGYIMRHCTVSPFHMKNEWDCLSESQQNVKLSVSALAHLTTPYEIAWNRTMSLTGNTCGKGVGATMHRNLQTPHHLYACDLLNPYVLDRKLKELKRFYDSKLKSIIQANELTKICNEIWDDFMNSVKWFRDFVRIKTIPDEVIFQRRRNIIFEGSQGILLDMDHGIFPHVTYANTTSKNIREILFPSNRVVNTYYPIRTYSTRHGNGPFPTEDPELKLSNSHTETNETNEWQGNFRIGQFDYEQFVYALGVDSIYSPYWRKSLCVSCLDQLPMDVEKVFSDYVGTFKIFTSDTPESKFVTLK